MVECWYKANGRPQTALPGQSVRLWPILGLVPEWVQVEQGGRDASRPPTDS